MAVAKPVLIEPPSLRLRGWWTTTTRGSASAASSARRPVASVDAVVDDDQLVVTDLVQGQERLAGLVGGAERPAQVGLFVPHREEDRQLLERRHPPEGSGRSRRQGSARRRKGPSGGTPSTRSASTRPMSGTNLKPWPEQARPDDDRSRGGPPGTARPGSSCTGRSCRPSARAARPASIPRRSGRARRRSPGRGRPAGGPGRWRRPRGGRPP